MTLTVTVLTIVVLEQNIFGNQNLCQERHFGTFEPFRQSASSALELPLLEDIVKNMVIEQRLKKVLEFMSIKSFKM